MKESLAKVKKIQDILVGLDMQVDIDRKNLDIFKYNLTLLKRKERDLVFNINFLKEDNVIATASEYKKSVDDLTVVRNKISELTSEKNNLEREIDDKCKKINNYQEDWDNAVRQLEKEKVVLVFDSSKRKAKSFEK